MGDSEVVWIIVAIIIVYQAWVSARLIRAPSYEPRQKWWQLAVIWFTPVFGAVMVQERLRSESRPPLKPEKGYTVPGDNASGPDD